MRNQALIDKWLAALRGSDYQQGQGYLHYSEDGTDKFCCLGVLCDLAGTEWQGHQRPLVDNDTGRQYGEIFSTSRNEYTMPDAERRTDVGLTGSQIEQLASLNDQGRKFHLIADDIAAMLAWNDKQEQDNA